MKNTRYKRFFIEDINKYKKVSFKGDDTLYYVVDSWKEDSELWYRVVIDEKINLYERYKNSPKRDLYSEPIPAKEFVEYHN